MNTLDIIRKLYDEDVDPAELERGLGKEDLTELRSLVEAKEAVDALPPRHPSKASLDAIMTEAGHNRPPKNRRLTVIFNPRFVQRLAAAAAIVAAVGLGYLTLQSPSPVLQTAGSEAKMDAETPAPAAEMATELRDEDHAAVGAQDASRLKLEAESSVVDRLARSEPETAERRASEEVSADEIVADSPIANEVAVNAEPTSKSVNDSVRVPSRTAAALGGRADGGRAILAGASTGDDALGGISWEDSQPFQTFYWQVQALEQRSPDDEWEEAVPLEGSFQAVDTNAQAPSKREADSEK